MYATFTPAIAAQHRHNLLVDAEHSRLVRAARSGAQPRTDRRRLVVRRSRLRPPYTLPAWFAAVTRHHGSPA